MVSFKIFVSLAVLMACAHAQPALVASHQQAPSLVSSIENSEPQLPQQSGEPLHSLAKGSSLLEVPKQDGHKEEAMREKKAVVYDFGYTYPAFPLVTSYQYQYQRAYPAFPYAYSAAYYPYVYGPSYFF